MDKQTQAAWYEASTGNHQGLIINEQTGANIAVAYDKQDARLIAAAPDLLDALQQVLTASEDGGDMEDIDWNGIRAAILKATA